MIVLCAIIKYCISNQIFILLQRVFTLFEQKHALQDLSTWIILCNFFYPSFPSY